jgi:hypothetical protein
MIHHLVDRRARSPACCRNARRVHGRCGDAVHAQSWQLVRHQHDEYGTGVEIYPAGTELRPAGPEGAGLAMTEPIRSSYSPTHFAPSVPISQEQITAIAEREGWQCHCCERGAGGFHVMEVWIENTGMVELLTWISQTPSVNSTV